MPSTHRHTTSTATAASSGNGHSFRNNLPRGKACMTCRRRKIKCDGRKPACGQCRRTPGTADDCEYPIEGRSRTQQLEETIKRLHERIGELEAAAEGGMVLHEPYSDQDEPVITLRMDSPLSYHEDSWMGAGTRKGKSRSHSPTSRVASPHSATSSSSTKVDDPLPEVTIPLVDTFLTTFSRVGFGFFLSPSTFRRCALYPSQHPHRPSPALFYAVLTWASHLTNLASHSPSSLIPSSNPEVFLRRTLHHLPSDITTGLTSPRVLLHAIQAEVLLALYYLTLGHPVEGTYHSSAAVSLALSAGLHRLGSSPLASGSGAMPFDLTIDPDATAPQPTYDERVAGFWTVLALANYWSVVHSPGPAAGATALAGADVDTPWPREITDPPPPPATQSYLQTPQDWIPVSAEWSSSNDDFGEEVYGVGAYDDGSSGDSVGLGLGVGMGMGLHEPSSMVQYPLPPSASQYGNVTAGGFPIPATSPTPAGSVGSPISCFLNGSDIDIDNAVGAGGIGATAAGRGVGSSTGAGTVSPLALLAKASILLERAARGCDGDVQQFDSLIERFISTLPPLDGASWPIYITHILARGAMLRLHRAHTASSPYAAFPMSHAHLQQDPSLALSRRKALDTSRIAIVIAQHLRPLGLLPEPSVNVAAVFPVVSALGSMAIETLLEEYALSMRYGGGEEHQSLLTDARVLLGVMRVGARDSPLAEHCANRSQAQYDSLAGL
ncbi:Zn(2)-Cys(6) binuclear cluster domain-containing protein [Mycena chlorophos]|uniref:Zn(2)-Cys(6) binuclear cluster domain-containing protein n=1 Tax=Mycena chlorophos TaxID=658473 RepID=A0A8H6VXI8_MYCCL|nr:Zn(2)-Cys(6) binuclear cluster domain-containing protein [Mycena chlorophos]